MTDREQLLEELRPAAVAITDRMLGSVSERRTWWRKCSSGLGKRAVAPAPSTVTDRPDEVKGEVRRSPTTSTP
jgi:hypothetical protein